MDRMLSIFPVFQWACVLLDACFSKKEEKQKRKNPSEIPQCGIRTASVFLKSQFVLPSSKMMGKEEGEQGNVVPFAVGPAQARDAAVLVPLAWTRSWGRMLSFLMPQNKAEPLFI